MREIINLKPVLKETVWGGKRLEEYGLSLPSDHVGESWAISTHPNGDDEIVGGIFNGLHLSQLWKDHRELFGNIEGECFPLLTKIIDAEQDLSIQVHPDDAYAKVHEHGSLGKMECWYVLDCAPDASIVIGHNAKTREEVKYMIEERKWKDFIREIPIKKGDFFQIEPGTVHAIKGGTLILETQQNSDVTYRVYDYDRLSNGKLRDLHVQQSIDVITAPYEAHDTVKDISATQNVNMENLVSCSRYNVWHMNVSGTEEILQDQPFMMVSIVNGEGTVDGMKVFKGKSFILPYGYGKVVFEGEMEAIISSVHVNK